MSDTKKNAVREDEPSVNFQRGCTVLVGPSKQAFTVHRDLLAARAFFFKSACSEQWLAPDAVIELPEDDPTIFQRYLECVYLGKARTDFDNDKSTALGLTEIWILADKLGDERAANLVIDQLGELRVTPGKPTLEQIKFVYDNTTNGASLWRFLVDLSFFTMSPEQLSAKDFAQSKEGYPDEFRLDFAAVVMEVVSNASVSNSLVKDEMAKVNPLKQHCEYHQHHHTDACPSDSEWEYDDDSSDSDDDDDD